MCTNDNLDWLSTIKRDDSYTGYVLSYKPSDPCSTNCQFASTNPKYHPLSIRIIRKRRRYNAIHPIVA